MNDYDTAHIRDILADKQGTHYTWTNAHVLRFLDTMIGKDAVELSQLYRIYPQQMTALMMHYGWSLSFMEQKVKGWNEA